MNFFPKIKILLYTALTIAALQIMSLAILATNSFAQNSETYHNLSTHLGLSYSNSYDTIFTIPTIPIDTSNPFDIYSIVKLTNNNLFHEKPQYTHYQHFLPEFLPNQLHHNNQLTTVTANTNNVSTQTTGVLEKEQQTFNIFQNTSFLHISILVLIVLVLILLLYNIVLTFKYIKNKNLNTNKIVKDSLFAKKITSSNEEDHNYLDDPLYKLLTNLIDNTSIKISVNKNVKSSSYLIRTKINPNKNDLSAFFNTSKNQSDNNINQNTKTQPLLKKTAKIIETEHTQPTDMQNPQKNNEDIAKFLTHYRQIQSKNFQDNRPWKASFIKLKYTVVFVNFTRSSFIKSYDDSTQLAIISSNNLHYLVPTAVTSLNMFNEDVIHYYFDIRSGTPRNFTLTRPAIMEFDGKKNYTLQTRGIIG
ncbi:MAG: hypothetical protein LBD41_08295 [Clostridiales Family XIII bacterium]|jgi:hypothetical protein|nr:hypothetical protein [Clostridiales Family XIII bacterium]